LTPALLICALIFFILSVVAALVLMIISARIITLSIRIIIISHFVLLILTLLFFLFPSASGTGIYHWTFLLSVCCAIIVSGFLLLKKYHLAITGYFVIYLFTIPVFVYSPSLLVRLITLHYHSNESPGQFRIIENVFLEKQRPLFSTESEVQFKLVRKYGIFYKTLERDLATGIIPDSVKALTYFPDSLLTIRIYFSNKLNEPDSLELFSDLIPDELKKDLIKQKK